LGTQLEVNLSQPREIFLKKKSQNVTKLSWKIFSQFKTVTASLSSVALAQVHQNPKATPPVGPSKMCYHKRIIYSCGHTGFGEEVRSCVAMKTQYCEGQLSGRCNTWKSHALHSLNVQIVCHKCQVKTTKLQEAMFRLKMGTKEQEAKVSVSQDRSNKNTPDLTFIYRLMQSIIPSRHQTSAETPHTRRLMQC
jgi:hypothetical protein